MELEPHKYYHLYNRSNGQELIFKNNDNYIFFLKNFRNRLEDQLETIAYCLMPTHFHFLVQIDTQNISNLKKDIGIFLSSYTKAFNKVFNRHGSLFQQHTKAKHIDETNYLLTLMTYIHQNPVRSNLTSTLEDWPFSSYQDYAGYRNGTLIDKQLISKYFSSEQEFIHFSEQSISAVKDKYWI